MGTIRAQSRTTSLEPAYSLLTDTGIYRLGGKVYQWYTSIGLYETGGNGTRLVYSVKGNDTLNAVGIIIVNAIVRVYGLG